MENKIKDLLNLINENPQLEIIAVIDNELFNGEDYGYTLGNFSHCCVGEYYVWESNDSSKVYTDRNDFIEDWINYNSDWFKEDTIEKVANEEANKRFKKAIIIYIS